MFHPTMSRTGRVLFYPVIRFCEWLGKNHPVFLVKIRYFAYFHKLPDLKKPKDMNEKILYMKLFTDTAMWTELADKYVVRSYIEQCGLSQYLIPLLGVWSDVDDIDFKSLPESLIFKVNNGVGKNEMLMIDGQDIDIDAARLFLNNLLHRKDVGLLSAEPHYRHIPPRIIAESLLPSETNEKSPVDYKIHCANGKAAYILVCRDRDCSGLDLMVYDCEWNARPDLCVFDSRHRRGKIQERPRNFNIMLSIAERLSKPFPFVRVDLYNVNGQIFFGEMTFTPLGGMANYFSAEFLTDMGERIDINYPNN